MRKLQAQLDSNRRMVDTDRFDLTVREVTRMATEGELVRAPEYQRKFRWDDHRESVLIESFFLGLPVPNLFVASNEDGSWELVDGLQRVTTLMHFVGDRQTLNAIPKEQGLVLRGLEKLTEFNDKSFDSLPTPVRLHFLKRPVPVIALSDKSDFVVRFDLFERLNRGGITLTSQEVRSCIHRGKFNDLLRELASNPSFCTLLKLKQGQQNDGTREEIVLKFFAYLNNQDEFRTSVTGFLNDYMAEATKAFDIDAGRLLFTQVVDELSQGLGGDPILRKGTNVTPLNQLEAILVAAGRIIQSGHSLVVPSDKRWLSDSRLVAHSTKGTNNPPALRGRIDRAIELLDGRSRRS